MMPVYSVPDAMHAIAKAMQYNDEDRFLDIRSQIEDWMQTEEEESAWIALLDEIESKFD